MRSYLHRQTRLACLLAIAAIALVRLADDAHARDRYLQPPQGAASAAAYVTDRKPEWSEALGTLLEDTYFAANGARGSVLAVGLFGAIGAGLNAAHVQSENRERASRLGDLPQTDLAAILRGILPAPAEGAAPVDRARAFELVPSGQFNFTTETAFSMACAISAIYPTGERRPWRGRYTVAMEGAFDSQQPETLPAAAATLEPCLREAYRLFAGHVDGTLVFGEPRRIQLTGYKIRARVLESEAPARLIVNDAGGVTVFAPGAATLVE